MYRQAGLSGSCGRECREPSDGSVCMATAVLTRDGVRRVWLLLTWKYRTRLGGRCGTEKVFRFGSAGWNRSSIRMQKVDSCCCTSCRRVVAISLTLETIAMKATMTATLTEREV